MGLWGCFVRGSWLGDAPVGVLGVVQHGGTDLVAGSVCGPVFGDVGGVGNPASYDERYAYVRFDCFEQRQIEWAQTGSR